MKSSWYVDSLVFANFVFIKATLQGIFFKYIFIVYCRDGFGHSKIAFQDFVGPYTVFFLEVDGQFNHNVIYSWISRGYYQSNQQVIQKYIDLLFPDFAQYFEVG